MPENPEQVYNAQTPVQSQRRTRKQHYFLGTSLVVQLFGVSWHSHSPLIGIHLSTQRYCEIHDRCCQHSVASASICCINVSAMSDGHCRSWRLATKPVSGILNKAPAATAGYNRASSGDKYNTCLNTWKEPQQRQVVTEHNLSRGSQHRILKK